MILRTFVHSLPRLDAWGHIPRCRTNTHAVDPIAAARLHALDRKVRKR